MAGNHNSGPKKEKPFADALRMEIKAAGTNHKALRRIAAALIDQALTGNLKAIEMLADRLDGRPLQQQEISTDGVAQAVFVIPQAITAQQDQPIDDWVQEHKPH